jgi:hypothetical protein
MLTTTQWDRCGYGLVLCGDCSDYQRDNSGLVVPRDKLAVWVGP